MNVRRIEPAAGGRSLPGSSRDRHAIVVVTFWLVALLLVPAGRAGAQTTASIFGTVSDETKLLLPGVTVTATNVATHEVRTTVTNAEGGYSLPELPLGAYSVKIELNGFKTVVREGIQLSLNRSARVDVTLAIGNMTDQVTVVGDAPLVETRSNEMAGLVDQKRIESLPLGERNTLALVSLMPGTNQLRENNTQGFTTNKVTANGTRQEDNNFLLDGGDNTSMLRNYGNAVPNPDAVQEFRVISNNYAAEYGKTAGVVVNVVTKSGTNQLRGSAFEFHRNDKLNKKDFFDATKLHLARNQYGGTIGGPIARDRTFFFGTFQGLNQQNQASSKTASVPTQAERNGDFSASVNSAGKLIVIRDPVTRQPFPGNVIPSSRLSPTVAAFLKKYVPLPNNPGVNPNALSITLDSPTTNRQALIKIDHNFSNSHKVQGAYFWQDGSAIENLGNLGYSTRDTKTTQYNLNVHDYWTITSTLLNHVRFTFSRSIGNRLITPEGVLLSDLGSNIAPMPGGTVMPPNVVASGYFDAGVAAGGPKSGSNYVVADTVDWLKGRHTMKFGFEGWMRKLDDISTQAAQGGQFQFDGSITGAVLADLVLGLSSEFRVREQSLKIQKGYAFYGFAQDNFRVNDKLTMNLGLRYELNLPPVRPDNLVKAYIAGRQSTCVPRALPGILFPCDGIAASGFLADKNDLAPRLGVAYDVRGNGRTSIRGGYGVAYTFPAFNALQDVQTGSPFAGLDARYTPGGSTTGRISIDNPWQGIATGNPFPTVVDPGNFKFTAGADNRFVDYNLKNAYFHQFNLSVQQQVGQDWGVEVAYVGNRGRNLPGQLDLNSAARTATATAANIKSRRPSASYQRLEILQGIFTSSYNGLQAKIEKRFSHGHSVLASYTLSKSMDINSFYGSAGRVFDNTHPEWDWGPSREDRRHTLVVSAVVQLPEVQGMAGAIVGGWSVNAVGTFYSGRPISADNAEASAGIVSGRDNDFDGYETNDRPVLVGNWKLPTPTPAQALAGQRWFDPAAFRANAPGENNVIGRNSIYGPKYQCVDVGLAKRVTIAGTHQAQIRVDAFNVFNFVNFRDPVGTLTSPNFGKILSSEAARTLQLGIRYSF